MGIASSWRDAPRRKGCQSFAGRRAMIDTVLLFREALYGALVIALACSVLGVYVVLRRIVFVGAAIAQLSSAGIALALYLAGAGVALGPINHPTAMSLLLTLIAVMFFASGARGRIPPD